MTENDMVTLPIPRQHYEAVIKALAQAIGSTGSSGLQDSPVEIPWTEQDLARLKKLVRRGQKGAMDLAAQRPGDWVSFAEVCRASGRTNNELRADMATFTMLLKRHFGRKDWPLGWQFGVNGDKQVHYQMEPSVAQIWRSLDE
jgi:hypothetical protein